MHVNNMGGMFSAVFVACVLECLFVSPALAQDASSDAAVPSEQQAQPSAPRDPDAIPALNQPFSNNVLGTLNVPFGWTVEEIADGVRVTEPGHPQPVAIEVALITRPLGFDAKAYAAALTKELASDTAGFAPRTLEEAGFVVPKTAQRPEIKDSHRLILQVQEGDHVMHFAVLIVPLGDHMLVASLGAVASRFENIQAETVLQAILASYVLP